MDRLRREIAEFLEFGVPDIDASLAIHETVEGEKYSQNLVSYEGDEGERIPAYLLLPAGDKGPLAGIVVHHQHRGQRHLGKSEVCGLAGDPLQAFGPALARQGIAVLAPDSICFEDRRRDVAGTKPDEGDVAQHYDELCYRLLRGDTLMRKVLSDSAQAVSVLRAHPRVAAERVGMTGHSYGGSTVLFHAALDERIAFACSSGAACSLEHRMAQQTGIEMSQVIPGFAARYDLPDLVACCAPRPILLVSATEDVFSQDAGGVVAGARRRCAALGERERIEHKRYDGGHALTVGRFDDIVDWLVNRATGKGSSKPG